MSKSKNNKNQIDNHYVVECPKCGWQYTLGEIFYTDYFFGHETTIHRTDEGKVDYIIDLDIPTYCETFSCINPNCGCEFKVHLDINSKVTYEEKEDFSTEWESIKINKEENK